MSHLGRPKKDKKQLSLADAFGIPQCSNQPMHHAMNLMICHLKVMNQTVQNVLKRRQHQRTPKEHSIPNGKQDFHGLTLLKILMVFKGLNVHGV